MKEYLLRGVSAYGLSLPEAAFDAFRLYYDFLINKNAGMNLTTVTGETDAAARHFLDSLALLAVTGFEGKTVIDVGSGAGFPGVPLKLARPSLRLTLLDAQQKRVAFLEELCRMLQLSDVRCVHARAEEAALKREHRDAYDIAVSRAVARLNVLCELCLPFVKPGGVFVAMKSTGSDEEIAEAEAAAKTLGAALDKIADYPIPGTDITHRAVVLRKTSPTPPGYPRRFAKIQKAPL